MAAKRRPHFLSPSTKSLEIDVAPVGANDPGATVSTIVNKPTTGTTSTVTFQAPVGNDDFVFADYDGENATGNQLGGTGLTQTIVAGVTNTVSATLDGYVANVKLSLSSAFAQASTDASGQPQYTIVGEIPVPGSVTLMDADGNIIVAPGTNPQVQIQSADGSFAVTTLTMPGSFTIQAKTANPGYKFENGEPVTTQAALQVSVASGADGSQQYETSFALSQLGLIYAASRTSPASATVSLFDQQGRAYSAPGGFPGLINPVAMVWDDVDRALFVADAGAQKILAFDPMGDPLNGWTSPQVPGITSLTFSAATGRVYAALSAQSGAASDAIVAFDVHGSAIPLAGFSDVNNPIAILYSGAIVLVNNPASGADLTVFSENGGEYDGLPFALNAYSANGFISFIEDSSIPSRLKTGLIGTTLFGMMGGNATFQSANYDLPPNASLELGATPFTVPGLTNPVSAVFNPLVQRDSSLSSGPFSIGFYAANATGSIVAVNLSHQPYNSVEFPSPPPGGSGFCALVATF